MGTIIEYIGAKGLETTGPEDFIYRRRLETPKPGDVVIWGEGLKYPFNKDSNHRDTTHGRIEGFGIWKEGEYHVCCEPGSVFLLSPDSVSISGGPFASVKPEHLKPTYTTKIVRFWNWGNNGGGAARGVDYYIERPVFEYVPK